MSIESVIPSNHLMLCHPLLLLPSIFPSIRVFSNELALRIRWPKYWSFSSSPSRENSRLISFRILKQGLTPCCPRDLKSLLQYHSSKASILHCSAFFMIQLSHLYMTTGKTITLTNFLSKIMSLIFNTLSRFVIAFLPRSKCLLNSWLHSLSAVRLKPKKIKSVTVSIVSPPVCHEVMGLDAMILVFWMLSFNSALSLKKNYTFIFIQHVASLISIFPFSLSDLILFRVVMCPAKAIFFHSSCSLWSFWPMKCNRRLLGMASKKGFILVIKDTEWSLCLLPFVLFILPAWKDLPLGWEQPSCHQENETRVWTVPEPRNRNWE